MTRRKSLLLAGIVACGLVGGIGYTKLMARIGSGNPPAYAPAAAQADRIVVAKAEKTLYLLQGDRVLRHYRISMGRNWQGGPKLQSGDKRTPEGAYRIDWRNPNSADYLSLHISYPTDAERARAGKDGVDPGGDIMIHGLPNGWGALGRLHLLLDWTDGCVAVTNAEMNEIWQLVPTGIPIEIYRDWQPS